MGDAKKIMRNAGQTFPERLEPVRGSSSAGSSSSNSSSNTHGACSSVSTTQSNSRSQGTNTETPSFLDSLAQAVNIAGAVKGLGYKLPGAT